LIASERNRFKTELEKTGLFIVYPSQANYFLCRCSLNFTAKHITEYLLEKHNIFIKDLSGKTGLFDENWIRIAIRDTKDNNDLLDKLMVFKNLLMTAPL
jgi:histidinol-phosphate/aromatic aminotransferase/cobyric acid decarboxylase-like protein